MAQNLQGVLTLVHRHRGLALPVGAAALVLAIFVPLPPGLVDVLLAGNITLSAMILLTSIRVRSPMEFSVMPSVLLVATLFRLVMNVATTRLILTSGAGGQDPQAAQLAAGRVVWTFSRFVTADSLTVGVILFAVLVVVQFVVITKGAGRISEVAARFVLDAMPGKQAGIDADLSGKLIDQVQARARRGRIAAEADFYGAMDGASKFLRGDAIAAAMITGVNILGGMYVGVVQYGWGWSQSADLFTRLTIGDGLAAQVPALLTSIAAAMLVSRSTARADLGEEMVGQLTAHPAVLGVTAAFLGALMFTSLPRLPLALMGAGCAGAAWLLTRRREQQEAAAHRPDGAASTDPAPLSPSPREMTAVDPLRIELGYSLVRLVEGPHKGQLLERIASLRRQIAEELGLLTPAVRIRDNLRLEPRRYQILVRGAKVGEGLAQPGMLLALGSPSDRLEGQPTSDPVFGAPAIWIAQSQRGPAESAGYSVVDACGVIVTHLGELIRRHAAQLLGRQQTVSMLEALRPRCPHLVDEVLGRFGAGRIQKVLCGLLSERVSIRDLEAVLEALGDCPCAPEDAPAAVEHVRSTMAAALSQQYVSRDGRLRCVCLSPAMEQQIGLYVGEGGPVAVPLEVGRELVDRLGPPLRQLQQQGHQPVVLVSPQIRPVVRRLLAGSLGEAAVLGYNEIDSVDVDIVEAPTN